ncbi:MAG: prolyl oligopeptidase family serine peptidase [Bryobacteraceae bacterium]
MRRLVVGLGILIPVSVSLSAAGPPPTPKHPVTDVYHGVSIVDDYRWLEKSSDPAVTRWVAAQNAYTRSILDPLPFRASLASEVTKAFTERPTSYGAIRSIGDRFFAIKREPAREQPYLVMLSSLAANADEKIVLDPLKLDPTGGVEIDFYVPSLDGKLVAVSLSHHGSEAGDVHVYETSTGRERVADTIPRVNNGTAGGSVAWNADGSGFFYTRYPRAGQRPPQDLDFYQQVYFHHLGQAPDSDRYEIGADFPRIAEIVLETSRDGRLTVATVANGDGGEFMHYLYTNGAWRQITHYSDQISIVRFGADDSLYMLSRSQAPMGKLLRIHSSAVSLANPFVIAPETDLALEDFVPASDRIYVKYLAGGPSEVRMLSLDGKPIGKLALHGILSVNGLERLGADELLFATTGYIEPPVWKTYSPKSDSISEIDRLSPPYLISFHDAEVTRDFAISKDGTRIPLNIIHKKGILLNGQNLVLLTGYGGFGISESPRLNPLTRMLLDHGFVYVTTNLRGGSDYGEAWHLAGNLTHKQNVFDDFYACARYLVDHHYTSPAHLSIIGGSNGGLLMGAAMTQHPEMYRVVLAFVGIYDMLRLELSPNGAFNVTEYGTVKELDQFKALYAYSPYQHVRDRIVYPAAIFLTGDNDPRVDPYNSRKMVARLQAAGPAKGPILLRTSSKAGHGIGSSLSETISQYTDALSFLFDQLSVH